MTFLHFLLNVMLKLTCFKAYKLYQLEKTRRQLQALPNKLHMFHTCKGYIHTFYILKSIPDGNASIQYKQNHYLA